jgi:hypothetical protein
MEGGTVELQESQIRNKVYVSVCSFSPFRNGGCITVTGGQEAGGEGPGRVNIISYVDFLHSGLEAA